jgi:hypothetical protein
MSTVYMTSADVRAARFEVLVAELRPMLRRSHPTASDEVVLEQAIHIAALRLAGGNITWSLVG